MLKPYKIRKPVYSGASKHFLPLKTQPDPTPASDADQLEQLARDDPRLIGGNLQKAILLDLIDLRGRFLENENNSTATSQHLNTHAPSFGTSFGRFKDTFRERRFGAIHTRAAPRNVDRGEYAQLIYSSCFYLLEESIDYTTDVHNNNRFNIPNAIFAIFSLYTLHETNPLPIAPVTRQSTPRTKFGNFDEDLLKEAWSALPISREEQNLNRRCYKSPVRIDRRNYMSLLQLSDVCKALTAQRCLGINESSDKLRSCHGGLAQDAVYIIHKMLFNENFFIYCEYHGPCGLEGLAGNLHFYNEHFAQQTNKPKKSNLKNGGTSPSLSISFQLNQDKLDEMKNDEHLKAILNLPALSNAIDKHKYNLQNVTVQLQKSKQTGELQPRQRDLVVKTLTGIVNSQQSYFGIVSELKERHKLTTSRSGKNDDKSSQLEAQKDFLPLLFPQSFSAELRGNVFEALADFSNEVALIRSKVMDEMIARKTAKNSVIDTNTSTVVGAQGENIGQCLGDILEFLDVQSDRSSALGVYDEMEIEDEISVATGAGKNALASLLQLAEDSTDSVSGSDSIGAGEAILDGDSVATCQAMKALQNLLPETAGRRPRQTAKRKKPFSSPSRHKRQKIKKDKKHSLPIDSDNDEDASEETEISGGDDVSVESATAGKDALAALLSKVESIEQV